MKKNTLSTRSSPKSLEESLLFLQKKHQRKAVSIQETLAVLSGKGTLFLLMLLSLPFMQPIPLPGLSTVFGLAIAFISLRMMFKQSALLPKRILRYKIQPKTFQKLLKKTLFVLKVTSRWAHPRLHRIVHEKLMQRIHGIVLIALGLFLAFPVGIPFTNILAAWAIFFIALGLLKEDGVWILAGYGLSLLTAILMAWLIFKIHLLFENGDVNSV